MLVGSRPTEADTLMERRAFLATLAGVFLTAPRAAEAQPAGAGALVFQAAPCPTCDSARTSESVNEMHPTVP